MGKEDDAAIAAVREGGRCKTASTLHEVEHPRSATCQHRWRTVACNSDDDVIECASCGQQRVCACDFDEDFA